ncbi:MAG: polysaccharide biosynthesis protein [Clostridia bacterium]|nr:polysaccharide biosynthesis protein [Clostridia bacterium]
MTLLSNLCKEGIILKNTDTKGAFLQGAFILTVSTAFVKLAGLLFTLPIANMQSVDMSNFYSAYTIYNMFAVLASAGLPVAVSRMVSETLVHGNTDEAKRIYTVSVRIFTVVGAVIAAVMFFGAGMLAWLIGNPGAQMPIRILSVTAFCSFVMSSLRGYFQGNSLMTYTAFSQVIEAFSKLFFGCALAYVIGKAEFGFMDGSSGAIAGVSIGAVLAVIYLTFNKNRFMKKIEPSGTAVRADKVIAKELFRIAIPVSLGASVMSLVNMIDTAVIMRVLQNGFPFFRGLGYTLDEAKLLYTAFEHAKKIFNFPSAFIVPFSVSILPALTSAFTARDSEGIVKNMSTCFKYALMLALPAGIGISVLSGAIMNIFYFNAPEEASAGTPILAVFGIAVVLYAVVSISGAILQSFGRVNMPLISLCVGALVKCVLTFLLVGMEDINILGAPIATCACYVVMIAMNLVFLRRYLTGCGIIIVNTLKTLAAALIMGAATYLVYQPLSSLAGMKMGGLISIVIAVIVYAALVLLLKIVTVKELKSMLRRG